VYSRMCFMKRVAGLVIGACVATQGAAISASNDMNRANGANGTMLLNRVGPVTSQLYIANADGSDEHKLLPTPGFDYHASFSKDGQ
jgi:hypothetical protein